MPTALILPLVQSEAGQWLAAIRQLADEDSRSDPHVTVRYPIKRIDLDLMESSRNATIAAIELQDAGSFKTHRGERVALYLKCGSDLLESFSYKPDYPDSVFHITLYEGPATEFSDRLMSLLYERPWHLWADLSPPSRIATISAGRNGGDHKRADRFTARTRELVGRLDPSLDVHALADLEDEDRLRLISAIVDHLHSTLNRGTTVERRPHIEHLTPIVDSVEQRPLWSGAPIAVSHAGDLSHRFPDEEARQGSLVLTPPELVEQIVSHALQLTNERKLIFGDPAFGSGIFFAVLARLTEQGPAIESASGVEINEDRALTAADRWASRGLEMLVGDFLSSRPVRQWNFVLANPPYVRSQDIDESMKQHAAERIQQLLRLDVSRRANLYVYFLLVCHDWICPGAISSWLIPADFMETTYGEVLRRYLTTRVSLLGVHTYEPTEFRFENVRVSSCVVTFRNDPARPGDVVTFSRGGSIDHPGAKRRVRVGDLSARKNWRLLTSLASPDTGESRPTDRRLGDLFEIRRGIATGANSYFVVPASRAAELGLEPRGLRPLLPRPRYMPESHVVERTADGAAATDPQLYVIDSSEDLRVLDKEAPNLASYLRTAPPDVLGGHLVSRRTPFYKQESRLPAPIVASSMGRLSEDDDGGPIQFYLNKSDAIALNNYLCLYLRDDLADRLDSVDLERMFHALRSIEPEEFLRQGREYAGGMYKVEPRELRAVRVTLPSGLNRKIRSVLGGP